MNNFVNTKARVLNTPLLLEPSYAQVLFGALTDRLGIEKLINGDETLDAGQLKECASMFSSDRSDRKPYQVRNGTALIP